MNIKVLIDNNTYIDQYYIGEPAVSYYITMGEQHILFDTGYSEAFIQNAKKMDIDLSNLTHVVISHGHNDHSNGIQYLRHEIDLSLVKLISHPDCFLEKQCAGEDIGAPYRTKELIEQASYIATKGPYQISENCIFLGEIPRSNSFEAKEPIGQQKIDGIWKDDYLLDDSALACKTKDGLFIITGCSHSGICNIIEYAMKVCKEDRIAGVLGGFHLFDRDDRMKKTIAYLKERQIMQLYPCHCVSLQVKASMMQELEVLEVGVGLEIEKEE